MHKRFILIACLIFTGFATQAQSLSNAQLLKLYGLMIDALRLPRPQLAEATRLSINSYLSTIDHNWLPMTKDDRIVSDDDMWFTCNHYTGNEVTATISPVYTIVNNVVQGKIEYYTPYASPYNISMAQISTMGKLISKKSNKYTGTDIIYLFKGITFLYSTFPPRKDGFKLNGKPVTRYKITINQDI